MSMHVAVEGRHPSNPRKPEFVADAKSTPEGVVIRVDDLRNPEAWLLIRLTHLQLEELLNYERHQ